MAEVPLEEGKARRRLLFPVALWKIGDSLRNLLAVGKKETLKFRPLSPTRCFRDRLKSEGRWEEYLAAVGPFYRWGYADYQRRRDVIATERYEYCKWREIYLYLYRQLVRIDKAGQSVEVLDLVDYLREYKKFMANTMSDTAAGMQDEVDLSFVEQMAWLQKNWVAVMEDDPVNEGKVVPRPQALLKSKCRGVFQMAGWAAKHPDEFMEECFTHLTPAKPRAGSGPAPEPKGPLPPDPSVAATKAYAEKWCKPQEGENVGK